MEKFFKLPKSIRKIITVSFFYIEENNLEKLDDFLSDDFYSKLVSIMNDGTYVKFYSDEVKVFTDFLKKHDIFNAEV